MRYAIANWKMNPRTRQEAVKIFSTVVSLAASLKGAALVVCPPYVWLPEFMGIRRARGKIALGAQDVFWAEEGAFTGEISCTMLKNFGVKFVIVGHSERREHLVESNAMVAKKLAAVLGAGLYAVLCVGERDRKEAWQEFLKEEFISALEAIHPKNLARLVVVYEPVWAISTEAGEWRADTPEDARTSIIFLRRLLADRFGVKARAVPILYGGSVNQSNIGGFAALEEISGALVGHASLDPVEFIDIAKILSQP